MHAFGQRYLLAGLIFSPKLRTAREDFVFWEDTTWDRDFCRTNLKGYEVLSNDESKEFKRLDSPLVNYSNPR